VSDDSPTNHDPARPPEATEPVEAVDATEPAADLPGPAAPETTEPEILVPAAASAAEPTQPIPAVTATPAAADLPATAVPPAAAPAAPGRATRVVAVPMWLLVLLGLVLGAVGMFWIGYAVGKDSGDDDRSFVETPFRQGDDAPFRVPNVPNQPNQPNVPNQPNPNPNQNPSGAFLGVATQQADNGLEITQVVDDSAADDAGLQVGDVITSVDRTRVNTPAQLQAEIADHSPGDSVEVGFVRNGQNRTVTVRLGSRNAARSN
jgi:membrane-associated protease RseP (regulator of RpoE activity)